MSKPSDLKAIFTETVRLCEPSERIRYVEPRLNRCLALRTSSPRRSFRRAAQVLNCGYPAVISGLRGSHRSDRGWLESQLSPELSKTAIGSVYFASPIDLGELKIGFSIHLKQRIASLSRECGQAVELLGAFAGTVLDEHLLHCLNASRRLMGEWFDNSDQRSPDSYWDELQQSVAA